MSETSFHVMASIKRALINVDLQQDFITGSLALKHAPAGHDAEDIIPCINHLSQHGPFDVVIYSLDYHPFDHISFIENASAYLNSRRRFKMGDVISVETSAYGTIHQQLWPRHCVQETEGAQLWPQLYRKPTAVYVYKGTKSLIESYSVFGNPSMNYDTGLHALLRTMGVTHLYLTGVAEDICVAYSALDALSLGYQVTVIQDATRGVSHAECLRMRELIRLRGGHYCHSSDLFV